MNKFVGRMLELGAELDQAVGSIEISMIINDAEILYKKHIEQLGIIDVNNSLTHDELKLIIKESCDIEDVRKTIDNRLG